jgi:hypothetical protein
MRVAQGLGFTVVLWLLAGNAVIAQPGPTAAEQQFLDRHWNHPLSPQGPPPADWPPLEASLDPESCGACHPVQLADWSTALHSKSMGPGVLGQMVDMVGNDPGSAQFCWRCHTPLAEQRDLRPDGSTNPTLDPGLQRKGLVCAGCHVRGHRRYGPPRRATPEVAGPLDPGLPHGGFTAETAFQDSAFCRGCHQFDATGFALNGKLIENTYEEWRASDYARRGVHCQDCHMPDRRHLWRGIHDPDMVVSGVTISVDVRVRPVRPGETVEARIIVANTGVGHFFPTYLTPKVFVRGRLLTASEVAVADTEQEGVIGREAPLDLSEELYDTRIPPGESITFDYAQAVADVDGSLEVEVEVQPDHFYARFYEALLAGTLSDQARPMIERALADANGSHFVVYRQRFALDGS